MNFETEIDLDGVDPVATVGTSYGVFSPYDLSDAREELIDREIAPRWLCCRSKVIVDMRSDDVLSDALVTTETILKNPWVDDFREAMDTLDEIVDPNAMGMVWGVNIVETSDVPDGIVYLMGDDDGVPDTDTVVRIDY